MNKILVTGGAGYIGSHTCKLLREGGFEPITYDNLSMGHESFVKWGPLEKGDILDTNNLSKVMAKYEPIAVIHFAASAYVGESMHDPLKYYRNNVAGTVSLLTAMKNNCIKKIIFSSSCATYGSTRNLEKITEKSVQSPINPYGESKLIVEKILSELNHRGELSHVTLRYFNAAGADLTGDIGEQHEPETHLIPLAINAGLKGGVMKIYGNDFDTPDGSAVRDFVHVVDLASAHLKSLTYLISGGVSNFYNVGTGVGYSVLQIIDALKHRGFNINTCLHDAREGDPPYLVADSLKIQTELGWKPIHSDLNTILDSAINWYRRKL